MVKTRGNKKKEVEKVEKVVPKAKESPTKNTKTVTLSQIKTDQITIVIYYFAGFLCFANFACILAR